MAQVISKIIEITKLVLPWLTGGLAGAILTYILNRKIQNKNRPELTIESTNIQYELDDTNILSEKLFVSYGSGKYENLACLKYVISNTGNITIDNAIFFIELDSEAEIVANSKKTLPLKNKVIFEKNEDSNIYSWITKEFKPGDISSINILINNKKYFKIYWRGIDNVRIIDKSDKPFFLDTTNDVSNIIYILIIIFTMGSFPLIGSSLQALLLLLFAPYLTRTITKYFKNKSFHKK